MDWQPDFIAALKKAEREDRLHWWPYNRRAQRRIIAEAEKESHK